jgi:Tfp pilus assembly protein PilO
MLVDREQLRATIVVVAIVLVFVVGLWAPLSNRAGELEAEILKLEGDLGVTRGRTDGLGELASEVDRLQAKVAETNKLIPQQGELAGLLRELSTQIETEALTDQNLATGSQQVSDEYATLPVELTFSGDSPAVFRFVRRVERMPRLVQVERLFIDRRDEAEGVVSAEMDLKTFFYTTEGAVQ